MEGTERELMEIRNVYCSDGKEVDVGGIGSVHWIKLQGLGQQQEQEAKQEKS
jgi:hypothetical protein